MIYTNDFSLPDAIVNAIGQPRPIVPGVFSASEISSPPYVRYLKEKHWDELAQDVSDMFWLLFCTAFHTVMETSAPKDGIAEERLAMPWG